ncbi:AI-2E family transporter [Pedobacter endophyticus]|uniref:AI-2E family transporter n=1 Tax=Pedobacter endophyticus TaxID=2789740 RepID=A0A7U3Q4T8_9SPHI|nr:AI-2E family transporter [Pedobacter endophyticus]QPH38610.1 AI-2E family transporter [Pedobacter endophyticus]
MQKSDDYAAQERGFKYKVWITGGILSFILITLLLFKTLFSVLLLALAGILMSIYFHGGAGRLKTWFHLPYKAALAFSVLLNIVLLTGFFWFVGARLQQQVAELSETLPKTIGNAKEWLGHYPLGAKVLDYLNASGDSEKTFSVARQFLSSSFGILSDLYIILLLGAFFTASPSMYKRGVISLLPEKAKEQGKNLLDEIHKVLKGWIKGQLFGFMFIAVLTGVGLWIMDMPLILTLALFAGLLNFIPNFGPIIAMVPASLLALMQGPTTALIVVGLYTAIQVVQSAVTQPLIQKKMINMPPALVIFGQVAMGIVGGFWGVLLATPVVAIVLTTINKLYVERQEKNLANSIQKRDN